MKAERLILTVEWLWIELGGESEGGEDDSNGGEGADG